MQLMLSLPGQKQRYADLHSSIWNTPWSPFISLTEDIEALLQTTDKWIASVITGFPVASMKAPFIFTYEIPIYRLVRPSYELIEAARIEREVLFIGRNIGQYLIDSDSNHYKPGDAINFQPPYGS